MDPLIIRCVSLDLMIDLRDMCRIWIWTTCVNYSIHTLLWNYKRYPLQRKTCPPCSPEELDAWKTTFLLVIDSNFLGHFTVSSTTIVLLEMPQKPYKNLQKINWALQLPISCCRCQKIQRDFTNFKNQLSPDHPDHSMFYWCFLHRSMAQDSTPLVVLWRPGCRCGGCSH